MANRWDGTYNSDIFLVIPPIWYPVKVSVFAQWSVFARTSEIPVKVMLDGQGADELFMGYRTIYFGAWLERFFRCEVSPANFGSYSGLLTGLRESLVVLE